MCYMQPLWNFFHKLWLICISLTFLRSFPFIFNSFSVNWFFRDSVFNLPWVLFKDFYNYNFYSLSYELLYNYYPYFSFNNSSFRIYPVFRSFFGSFYQVLYGPVRLFEVLFGSFWSFSVISRTHLRPFIPNNYGLNSIWWFFLYNL